MKIVRTYVLKELFVPFILSMLVLTCVFLLGNLIKLTDLVINKGVPLASVGKVFALSVPVLIGYTLPLACLISVIIAFSRMSIDNEILALRASGVHLWRILKPLFLIGLIMSLFSIILNERIIPYAHYEQKKSLKNLGLDNPTALLEAGVFINSFNGQILFIHEINDNKMYNITIYQPQEDGRTRTIIARQGEFTPVPGQDAIKLKLIDGTSDEPNLEDPENFYKLNFKTYFMTLGLSGKKQDVEKKPKSMTLKEIVDKTEELEELLVDTTRLRTEFWRKITWSFSPLFFILLGFPMAVITHRREKSANVVLAVICAAFYYLISLGCEGLAVKSIVEPAVIMWVPNALAAATAIFLNFKCVS